MQRARDIDTRGWRGLLARTASSTVSAQSCIPDAEVFCLRRKRSVGPALRSEHSALFVTARVLASDGACRVLLPRLGLSLSWQQGFLSEFCVNASCRMSQSIVILLERSLEV